MCKFLKILLVPAAFGLMSGAVVAAPANVGSPMQTQTTDADPNVSAIHYRGYWHGHRHWRHRYHGYGYHYRPYRYRPYGYYRPYYYRPYYRPYYHRPYYGPRVRFHLGIGL